MLSVNVPVPGRVKRLASDLHPQLVAFDRVREDHTLVLKRLGDPGPGHREALMARAREALAGTAPFAVRIARVGVFEEPPAGPGPVVYLAAESPGLRAAHEGLCDAFDTIPDLEGEDYVPHITLARDGDLADARALAARDVEPVEWTVEELVFWARDDGGRAGRMPLPV